MPGFYLHKTGCDSVYSPCLHTHCMCELEQGSIYWPWVENLPTTFIPLASNNIPPFQAKCLGHSQKFLLMIITLHCLHSNSSLLWIQVFVHILTYLYWERCTNYGPSNMTLYLSHYIRMNLRECKC